MSQLNRLNLAIGAIVTLLGVLVVFLWVPMDTVSGIASKVRGKYVIGDALAPTIAGVFLLIGGLMVLLFERKRPDTANVDAPRLTFVAMVVAILSVSFLLMTYAGPLAVAATSAITGQEMTYRPLRGTFPWKYIGYFLGAGFAIAAIISLCERRITLRAILIGAIAASVLIFIYDVPFDDLLLPPNGDV